MRSQAKSSQSLGNEVGVDPLLPVSLAVHTAWPAARAAHAFDKFGMNALNAALSGFDELGTLNPTNPLIAR